MDRDKGFAVDLRIVFPADHGQPVLNIITSLDNIQRAQMVVGNDALVQLLHLGTGQDMQDFISWEKNLEKMNEIPHTCTKDELLIHCVAAKKIIDIYRATSQDVVAFWQLCNDSILSCLSRGKEYKYKCITFKKEAIELPSGLSIRYPNLEGHADNKGRVQWQYGGDDKNKPKKLYGGKIVENIVQAVARCVMTDGMLRIQRRYPCVLTVHDEVVVLRNEY